MYYCASESLVFAGCVYRKSSCYGAYTYSHQLASVIIIISWYKISIIIHDCPCSVMHYEYSAVLSVNQLHNYMHVHVHVRFN